MVSKSKRKGIEILDAIWVLLNQLLRKINKLNAVTVKVIAAQMDVNLIAPA